jgi:histidyl-tRNA synthetase
VSADAAFEERPLKAQLRMADRFGARFAAIVGDAEVEAGTVALRRLAEGSQEAVATDEVAAAVEAGRE